MRSDSHVEETFRAQLEENMRRLVDDPNYDLHQKIAAIKKAIADNSKRLGDLQQTKQRTPEAQILQSIERYIGIHERAHSYLVDVAKGLMQRENSPVPAKP